LGVLRIVKHHHGKIDSLDAKKKPTLFAWVGSFIDLLA
jgi:hypothetical protein